jgi:signal peptidase II
MKATKNIYLKFLLLFSLFAVGCNTDLTTKKWAESRLKDDVSIPVIDNVFDFTYVENHAVSFGLLHEIPYSLRLPVIFTLTISASLLILFMIWNWRNRKTIHLIPLVLILAGAVGNILDRMMNGYVIDFIHFHYDYKWDFPVFNIADMLVFCGVVLLFILNRRSANRLEKEMA